MPAMNPVFRDPDPTTERTGEVPPTTRVERAWVVLRDVPDPEVPALSIVDLGIVRDVVERDDGVLDLIFTPTYSGCPATEAIESSALAAIDAAALGPARVTLRRAPAWTSDWISVAGRDKLRDYGIAPPGRALAAGAQPLRFVARAAPPCPRCGSTRTERLSAFGSTACKSLHRCLACREPFEHFKPI
jgi:ring-1,2-phenylacetyl-CoA epoxidase subunit PaaD